MVGVNFGLRGASSLLATVFGYLERHVVENESAQGFWLLDIHLVGWIE